MSIFLDAMIVLPNRTGMQTIADYEFYKVGNLDSPFVQTTLELIEPGDVLKINNLGRLYVRDVSYTKSGGLILECRELISVEPSPV